ncbi:MAG TPA: bifunctional diaminohydroxyphosphoribosylaminopyrimidine deaminase/5-amino-6-(5-phosphoribosylamino)uracil reductase RibD, partial [candidate division Zixibacteria bacterium]|nr:bifunctional diaminohydroxyphosphoribosylaminopyrimidine deaminase/5-amino-6-(5-phosphoribosylamino)uracil reductase RibD [candidate division Zixibacteria bacterium]
DPNPKVNGKGIEILKKNKIKVEVGLLEGEARKLNENYIKYIATGLPFVILKWASTLDGKIATVDGDSKWISNEQSRKFAHRLRSQADAVLVGVETVKKDDPELNTRLVKGKNPVKIILDTRGSIPLNSKIVSNAKSERTILATVCAAKEKFENSNLGVWKLRENKNGRVDLLSLLKRAGENKITSILVEGGQKVLTSFMQDKLVDKVYCFIAPKIIGKGLDAVAELGIRKISDSIQLKNVEIKKFEDNVLISGYPVWRN